MTAMTTHNDPPPSAVEASGRRTGMRMSVLAGSFAVALVVGFFFVNAHRRQQAAELASTTKADISAPPPVDVVVAKSSPLTQQLVLPGETAAWYESRIYSRVNGYVTKWFVDIGDHVNNGQVLATIETPELDAELLADRAKLNAARAQVDVKQANADFAKSTYERWRDSPQGVVSQQERDSKKANFVGANAELIAAKAQVALDQADVDRLISLTAFKEVKAPFDGIVVERAIDIGDLVTAGSTSGTSALYRISRDQPMRVFVNVPQRAATQLLTGTAQAMITVGGDANHQYEGKVARTSRAINPQARTLRVEVDLPNSDSRLVSGMYVRVGFTLRNPIGVQVPAAALLFRPGPQVAIIDDQGKVAFRDIKIGVDDGSVVQVESGLREGDKVVLNLSSQIAAGTKVNAHDQNLLSSIDSRSVAATQGKS